MLRERASANFQFVERLFETGVVVTELQSLSKARAHVICQRYARMVNEALPNWQIRLGLNAESLKLRPWTNAGKKQKSGGIDCPSAEDNFFVGKD